jgi:hypothetical protein
MKSISKLKLFNSGFLIGFACALVGSVIFAILEMGWMTITENDLSFNFLFFDTFLFFFIGLVFSAIPAMIVGAILESHLHNQMNKGLLNVKKSIKDGVFLAILAIIIICGFGIFVSNLFALHSHNQWSIFLGEMNNGNFLINSLKYLFNQEIVMISRLWREILTSTLVACFVGGWAGRYFAKRLLAV